MTLSTDDIALEHELVLHVALMVDALNEDGASDARLYALLDWMLIRADTINVERRFSVESVHEGVLPTHTRLCTALVVRGSTSRQVVSDARPGHC